MKLNANVTLNGKKMKVIAIGKKQITVEGNNHGLKAKEFWTLNNVTYEVRRVNGNRVNLRMRRMKGESDGPADAV